MSHSGYVHLEVEEVVAETEKALLLRLEDGGECWVPKSVIADADDYSRGDVCVTVSVREWFAEKEGLV